MNKPALWLLNGGEINENKVLIRKVSFWLNNAGAIMGNSLDVRKAAFWLDNAVSIILNPHFWPKNAGPPWGIKRWGSA